MKPPVILINYKAYENSYGKKSIEITKKIEKVSKEYGTEIIVSVPATMIHRISEESELTVFAQHVDSGEQGARTGAILPEMIKDAGARGSLLNHSERRIRLDEMAESLERIRVLNLESVVCVDRYELVLPVALLRPNAVLIEPPELIGTGIPVSKAKPEAITKAVEEIKKTKDVYLLAGAGITTGEDVFKAIELGADGIGAASAVMKAKEPEKVVEDFVKNAIKAMEKRGE
ncbi:triose-phosphate isomerase [Sulfolobus acidocaldarius]|uniref:Triosephosphate isomerase n=4 Tax=Sulfolobus acidocaldarius TaxID=2285 RepID=TPIS_SULAC|nr:triose-phosphate isomerase [Sulfolobus acidocaldarius]Q4JCD8.1 RecName: Full=Triosephosphate isomerase; Short=TIM; Short=TPI; AltName: Full=Triose-phosphate isomerase [Sulfolobus acidocaldarius DSM 639]AAY79541.1 triosephosphate isomerase P [Sulfolobus acidocaldarius DSM 639]AGE70092.1 triosephosphate isomerase [Sulfolobus acidocaldarius N8]AGE72367.1 triosephosphate isomerase [Sulfolobus acidocaldarius Ron12/I]ALU29488.1 triose-phosphate isomerase [Sulfolobus acidocaldarius]ALU32217.1 tri